MKLSVQAEIDGKLYKAPCEYNKRDIGDVWYINGVKYKTELIRVIPKSKTDSCKIISTVDDFYHINLRILLRTAYKRTNTRDLAIELMRKYDIAYDDTLDCKDVTVFEIVINDMVMRRSIRYKLQAVTPTTSGYFNQMELSKDIGPWQKKFDEAFDILLCKTSV